MKRNREGTNPELPHVVIVGGGFGGLKTAQGLANKEVRVTLIDQHNFHTFLPLLYQVATAGLEPADVAYPIRTIFRNAANIVFRHGRVTAIDWVKRDVIVGASTRIAFDQLVLATGASAEFFDITGAAQYALPLYSLADARQLRNRLLLALEKRDAAASSERRSMSFVVVGGGPTGVETAGAIMELLEICVRRDRLRIDLDASQVLIVDLMDRLLTPFPASASAYAAKVLAKRGVSTKLGVSVVSVSATGVTLSDGSTIDADAVIWAAGVSGTGTVADELPPQARAARRIKVNHDLSVPGFPGVWAVGDAAAVLTVSGGEQFCPQLAPVAIQSGTHCAKQILATVNEQETKVFKYRNKGIMATIGRHAAIAQLPRGPVVKGTAGWLAWLGLHLAYLVGFRNRIRVLMNWTWRYLDWPSGPRLIVADAETVEDHGPYEDIVI